METAKELDVQIIDWTQLDQAGRDNLMDRIRAGEPAAISGMPNETYHQSIGDSSTGLKVLSDWSPYHYQNRLHVDQTDAMVVGNVLHCMVLEPKELLKRYIFAPGLKLNTKAGKEAMEIHKQRAERQGKEVVREDHKELQVYADHVRKHRSWSSLCGNHAQFELSVYCTDEETGILVKCRTDLTNFESWHFGERNLICDLKSAKDPRFLPFSKQIVNLGYDFSASMYASIMEQVFGKPCDYAWIVIPKKGLPTIGVYLLGKEMRDRGTALYRNTLKTLKECRETDSWPELNNDTHATPIPPAWARLEESE